MDVYGMFAGFADTTYGRTHFRDYEKFPYGTLEKTNQPPIKDLYSKVKEKCQQSKSIKKECPFCKEQKKRPLVSYLRKRQMRKHNDSICEEEEEEEDEERETEEHNEHHTHCEEDLHSNQKQ